MSEITEEQANQLHKSNFRVFSAPMIQGGDYVRADFSDAFMRYGIPLRGFRYYRYDDIRKIGLLNRPHLYIVWS